mgnify:CR=1 FL=1
MFVVTPALREGAARSASTANISDTAMILGRTRGSPLWSLLYAGHPHGGAPTNRRTSLLLFRAVFRVLLPSRRIVDDVFADVVQFPLVADDAFEVVTMPQPAGERRPIEFLDTTDVCVRGHGLEPVHYVTQRRGTPVWVPLL